MKPDLVDVPFYQFYLMSYDCFQSSIISYQDDSSLLYFQRKIKLHNHFKFKRAKKLDLMPTTANNTNAAGGASVLSPRGENKVYAAATRALAIRWVRLARDTIDSKRRNKALNILNDLEGFLEQMGEENNWYYTGAVRLEGEDLYKEGKLLQENRSVLETEVAIKISKIEVEKEKAISDAELELTHEKRVYEVNMNQVKKDAENEVEKRVKEIEATQDAKQVEFQALQTNGQLKFGFIPPDMLQAHAKRIMDYEDQLKLEKVKMERKYESDVKEAQAIYERLQSFRKNEVERKKAQATEKCNTIRNEFSSRIRAVESGWQIKALRWNAIARKKIELKTNQDEAASATNVKKSPSSAARKSRQFYNK